MDTYNRRAFNMVLNELLDSLGINKKQLADIAGISRQTLTRMNDDVEQYVIDAVDVYRKDGGLAESIPTPECTVDQVVDLPTSYLDVTNRNLAVTRLHYGADGWSIDRVANLFNLSVSAYNRAIDALVRHCMASGDSFKALRD